jgi:hypothetical protein
MAITLFDSETVAWLWMIQQKSKSLGANTQQGVSTSLEMMLLRNSCAVHMARKALFAAGLD